MKLKSLPIILLAVVVSLSDVVAQKEDAACFYKHYTGILDTNMRLTMDLYSRNGKISGYYFYAFEIQGEGNQYHYGKTIPLTGTLDGDRLVLHEYSNTSSKFTADLDNANNIAGHWKRRVYEDPISFSLSEDYKVGSIRLQCINKSDVHVLNLPDVPRNQRPSAKIDLYLLYPAAGVNTQLLSNIDKTMAAFILNDSLTIGDPELLVENITFDYFESYREATDGIPNIEQTASFNWIKQITMEALYNENSLLSLKFDKYGYTGGAHGVNISRFRVFNLRTNKAVELSDIFVDGYETELNEILDKKLRKLNGVQANEALIESGFLVEEINLSDNFYINNDGIGFHYNVYEIASYATGTTELFCTFYDLKHILKANHPFFWISK